MILVLNSCVPPFFSNRKPISVCGIRESLLRRQQKGCALKNGANVFREHKGPRQKLGVHDGAAVVMGLDKLAGDILEN